MEKISGIYAIVHTPTKRRYVGSAVFIERRTQWHKTILRRNKHHSIALQRAWNKYGENAFEFLILEICSIDMLICREQYYINEQSEFNSSKTAGSKLGIKDSEKTRIRKRLAYKGHLNKPETRAKMAKTVTGHLVSQETRNKISAKLKGIKLRPETCAKMSASRTGRLNPYFGRKHSDETLAKLRAGWVRRKARQEQLSIKEKN